MQPLRTALALALPLALLGACEGLVRGPISAPPSPVSHAAPPSSSAAVSIPPSTAPASEAPSTVGMANPASQNCEKQGGTLRIVTSGSGTQYGECQWEENRACEEWALMRGDCPVGGLKLTGYATPAARYCAILGGEYAAAAGAPTDLAKEQGSCKLPGGKSCEVWALWDGTCS